MVYCLSASLIVINAIEIRTARWCYSTTHTCTYIVHADNDVVRFNCGLDKPNNRLHGPVYAWSNVCSISGDIVHKTFSAARDFGRSANKTTNF